MAVSESESGVIPVPSLQEFFRDSVDAAMVSNKVAVEDHTAHYVVSLLTLFARSEALHEQADGGPGLKPLALMLADAAEAGTCDSRNAALQRLGDVALFVAGFMAEGLDRKAVGVGYYVRMGAWRVPDPVDRPCHRIRAAGPLRRYSPSSAPSSQMSLMC